MAKQIKLTGAIVPSEYDGKWAKQYIDNGVIMPLSAFQRQLEAAGNDDVEVYVNSPGGSVFAGAEMANAVRDAAAKNGKAVSITVGALAASAAANFLVSLRPLAKVKAHANAKLMFHSASTSTEGGVGAHADNAELLAKINGEVMTALTSRHGIAPEKVAQWFAEGRMGWLTAEEAKACGLVDEIIAECAPKIKPTRAAVQQFAQQGLKVAALAVEDGVTLADAAAQAEIDELASSVAKHEADAKAFDALMAEANAAKVKAEEAAKAAEAKAKADCEAAAADIAAKQVELVKALDAEKAAKVEAAAAVDAKAAAEKLAAEAVAKAEAAAKAEADAKADAEKQRRIALKLNAAAAPVEDAPQTFAAAVKRLEARGMNTGDAYVKARNEFPHLFALSAKAKT